VRRPRVDGSWLTMTHEVLRKWTLNLEGVGKKRQETDGQGGRIRGGNR
jgi:hypothetical protein